MSENKKEKKGSNPFIITVIILLVIALTGGGVFAGMYVSQSLSANAKEAEGEITETLYEMDEFLVNLADSSSRRYVKVKIYASYNKNNIALTEELNMAKTKPILMDGVLSVLRSKTTEDFFLEKTEQVKRELKEVINSRLKNGQILEVYFPELIVQ